MIMSAVMFIFIAATQLSRSAKQEDFAMEKAAVYWSLFRSPNPQVPSETSVYKKLFFLSFV